MKKKFYNEPLLSVRFFVFRDVLTVSNIGSDDPFRTDIY